ncbi:MAG TPA: DCC1-like thiol-disulfide oxidoreductase family protein [Gemmatimonadaceae bacterium]
MRALTVLYDPSCEFCRGARDWLAAQPKRIPVALVAAGSAEARALYPELDHDGTLGQLTAVDDAGNVYREEKAWLTALWATREHHALASRLSSAPMLPVARAASEWIGRNRGDLGGLIRRFHPAV